MLPTPLARRECSALVDDDLIQPSPEMIGILASTEPTERTHESRLKNVIGIYSRAKHPYSEASTGVLMSPHQTGERIDVAAQNRSYQFRIRCACHKSKTTEG